jgi:glycosidase
VDASPWTLAGDDGHVLRLDPSTGLPAALGHGDRTVGVRSQVALAVGGTEERGPLGGLVYPGAATIGTGTVLGPPEGDGLRWTVRTEQAGWRVDWMYRPVAEGPAWAVSARLRATPPARPLRGLAVTVDLDLPDAARWRLDAPGNRVRPNLPLADLTRPIGISTLTGLRGSPGVICLTAPDASHALLLWPDSTDELTRLRLAPGPAVTIDTGIAAAPDADIRLAVARVGLHQGGWSVHRDRVRGWYRSVGVALPEHRPRWTSRATIFEAQVGFSVFGPDGWTYEPYPTAKALVDDLRRIRDLGFDTIQLMPRQPYPSYNVHDYADVATSYGDEEVIAQLVRTAHGYGMRVILDIILHGVLDRESVDAAVTGVRNGPYAYRIHEGTPEISGVDLLDTDPQAIAWSRHILDFAPYWRAGSPPRHPLYVAHPEWFCTDSAGHPAGIYTKAFDLSHPDWQRYAIDAMVGLVYRLDVDGFRFDAPTYNSFASWGARTRGRASAPATGAIALFRLARERLKSVKPDLLMYTEPSGPALRQSMDLNYNYDEQWLIPAVMSAGQGSEPWLLRDAADLAAWFADRDRTLPSGAATAHHIDSHDTFWWPLPGAKWRREQYGIHATRALASAFALGGGAYMGFAGAEAGIEEHLRNLNRLRAGNPAIRDGVSDFDGVRVDPRDVFAVVRRPEGAPPALVLVNLAPRPVHAVAEVSGWPTDPVVDLLGGGTHGSGPRIAAPMAPYQTLVLSPDP